MYFRDKKLQLIVKMTNYFTFIVSLFYVFLAPHLLEYYYFKLDIFYSVSSISLVFTFI